MKYSIAFSSKTGNTALLAERLREILPPGNCDYAGPASSQGAQADFIFFGFWTEKGDCDEAATQFLNTLGGKQVFLFGTVGFGGSESYYSQILSRVSAHLEPSNTLAGTFMCQGKMPAAIRERYEAMLPQEPERMRQMLENFDAASSHPDNLDLQRLEEAALAAWRSVQ